MGLVLHTIPVLSQGSAPITQSPFHCTVSVSPALRLVLHVVLVLSKVQVPLCGPISTSKSWSRAWCWSHHAVLVPHAVLVQPVCPGPSCTTWSGPTTQSQSRLMVWSHLMVLHAVLGPSQF